MIDTKATSELFKAMRAAQADFKPLQKSGFNSHLKNKYATLADMLTACESALVKHGLNIPQVVEFRDGQAMLVTYLIHPDSGGVLRSEVPLNSKPGDPQSLGSWITYARRYGMSAMLCLEGEFDDDAEAAMERPQPKQPPKKQPEPNYIMQVRETLKKIGCTTAEDADAVLWFCAGSSPEGYKQSQADAKACLDGIQAKCNIEGVCMENLLEQSKLAKDAAAAF
jgi:hypothetical protein